MKNYLKSLLSVTAVIAMLFTLVACETNNNDDKEVRTTTTSEPVSITVFNEWVGSHPFTVYWDQRVGVFIEEYPDIEVNIEEIAGGSNMNMDGKLKILISSGELPDVFYTNDKDMIRLAKNANLLSNLKPYLDNDPEFEKNLDMIDLEDWNDGLDNVYGISSHKDLFGYFYNKEMFENAGIEEPAKTWDVFFDNCDKLKASGVAPIALDTKGAWMSSLMLLALTGTQNDAGNEFVRTSGPSSYETPEFIKAAGDLQKIFLQYTTKDTIGGDYGIASNNFLNGQAAIVPNGTWMIPEFSDETKAPAGFKDKVGVAMFPNGGIFSFPAYAWFSGSKDADKAKAAYDFIKHFNDKEDQIVRFEMLNFIPCSNDIDVSTLKIEPLLADYIAMKGDIKYRMMSPWRVYQSSVNAIISQEIAALATEVSTPEEFAKKLTEEANKK